MALDGLAADYEVFLSFRGLDLRQGLMDNVCQSMKNVGIHFFYDDAALHPGDRIDEILSCIHRSHVYVVMFSENYANSTCCLQELALMVKLEEESNGAKVILPCFCGVTVENVKLEEEGSSDKNDSQKKPSYKEDLQNLKVSEKQKEEWGKALKKATRFKGLQMGNARSVKFSEMIAKAAQLKLKERHLSIEPVGTYEDADRLEKKLDIGSGDVKFLVIHGERGTGKTTLARTVFQRLSNRFQGSSFISDVKIHNGTEGRLKQKMLRDICGDHAESGDVKTDFCDKRVLIVLDDVDKYGQIKKLAGSSTWFGPGSRIIITSTERGVLSLAEKRPSSRPTGVLNFKVEKMDVKTAGLELFSRCAFWRDSPLDGYRVASLEIVEHCEGLPLVVEIMGSLLRRERDQEQWKAMIKQLEGCKSVEEKLEISYQKLTEDEQYIFLDVACFFVDEEKTNPTYMWENAKALDQLLMLSLVKIVDGNKLWMPHALRKLGRRIVKRAGKSRSECCRFWKNDEALTVLKDVWGTEKVTGISFQHRYEDWQNKKRHICEEILDLTAAQFANKRNLIFLKLYYVRFLDEDFGRFLAKLRWLSCHFCPPDFQGKNIGSSSLVILDLAQSYIKDDWSVWEQLEKNNLKVIDLTSCGEITKTPGFSNFANLERLILEDCAKLAEIDSSIGDLKQLKCLNLKGCDSLEGLPDEICSVKTLTEILISKKKKSTFRLPHEIGSLKSLTVLEIVNVKIWSKIGGLLRPKKKKIGGLPKSVGDLEKLQRLSVQMLWL